MKSAVKEGEERGRGEKEGGERKRKERGREEREGRRQGRERRERGSEDRGERGVPESFWAQNNVHHIITTRHTFHAPPSPDHNTRNKSGSTLTTSPSPR